MASNITRFSPEQDAAIRAGYERNDAVSAIVTACLALTGGHRDLTPERVMNRARKLGCVRPDGWKRAAGLRGAATRWGGGEWRNVVVKAVPEPVPLRELVRIGRELGLRGEACLSVEAVSRAARRADPGFAGYRIVSLIGAPRAARA